MQKGYLIFNGGEAFSPRSKNADHAWLQLIRGTHRPRVVVVPVAAMEKHQRTADEAMRYFNYMGTFAQYSLITSQESANARTEYEVLNKVEVIALTDGSPIDMVERLKGTQTEAALHEALLRKAAVMATGASAMALGAVYWFAHEWLPGIGLAPHLAVMCHHNLIRMRMEPDKLLAGLPEGVTLIGIDQATTLICHPDGLYQVEGEGLVTVYRSATLQDDYRGGRRFRLEDPPSQDSTPETD